MRSATRWPLVYVLVFFACEFPRPADVAGEAGDSGVDGNVAAVDWVARHGGAKDDWGTAVVVAPNGDLVATGAFSGTITLGGGPLVAASPRGAWVARYRPDGSLAWSVAFSGTEVSSSDIDVDAHGDVYVSGFFTGPVNLGGGTRAFERGLFLVKFSPDGAFEWDRVFANPYAIGTGTQIVVLDAERIAMEGPFIDFFDLGGGALEPSGGRDRFVAVYRTDSGAHVWSKALSTTGEDGDYGGVVAVNGDAILYGEFRATANFGGAALTARGISDFYVVRLRGADGGHVWSMRQGRDGSSTYPMTITSNGESVFIGGYFTGTTNLGGPDVPAQSAGSNAFLVAYNAFDGSHVWSKQYGGSTQASIGSMAAESAKLAVGVSFAGAMSIGPHSFTAGAGGEMAILRVNPSTGEPGAAVSQFGSSSGSVQYPNQIYAFASFSYSAGRLAGIGRFAGSTTLFGTPLVSAGGSDIAAFSVDF